MGENDASQIERALFEAALGIRDGDVRQAFLVQACGGDTQRLERIREWLNAVREADSLFCDAEDARVEMAAEEVGALPAPPQESDSEGEGSQIGPYHLLERIGDGGWGVVYLAEQRMPVQRKVALKIIRRGLDTEKVIARFEIERQSLALMEHPNIARVLDAGATKSGRPYFVMELVHGERITDHCDTHKLDIKERIQLFSQVCQAIQHAHQKGVIHRDIKPSNILVSTQDGLAMPKVIDFGIARAAEGRFGDQTSLTAAEQFMGTPAYMSPEQAEGSRDLDTRSDVYSLGILLCELLTSATPFAGKRLTEAGMFETLRILREEEPLAPSALLLGLSPEQSVAAAEARGTDPKHLYSMVSGDLDWIVLKALSKDRNQRYSTVNGLSFDLYRYRDDEPVLARPPSRLYLFGKLVRRNKAAFVAAVVVTLVLAAGLTISSWFYVKERQARETQERLRTTAEEAQAEANRLLEETRARATISEAATLLSAGSFAEADAAFSNTDLSSIKPGVEAANVFRVLGDWNTVQNRNRRAADFYKLFLQANRLDRSKTTQPLVWRTFLPIGPALVEAGDRNAYLSFREDALACYQRVMTPNNASALLKSTLLLPADDAWLEKLRKPAESITAAYQTDATGGAFGPFYRGFMTMTLSLLEYRRGNFKDALEWGRRSMSIRDNTRERFVAVHAINGMAAHQLGNADQARSELKLAKQTYDRFVVPNTLALAGDDQGTRHDWSIARVLLREATETIEGTTKNAETTLRAAEAHGAMGAKKPR